MNNPRAVFARLLPFAAFIVLLALESSLGQLFTWLQVDIKWTYFIRVAAVLALLCYFWADFIELTQRPAKSDFVYAAIAGSIVFIIWIFPYPSWLVGNDTTGFNPYRGGDDVTAILWISIRLMGAVLIVPVMEELFWRSYITRWFDNTNFLSVSPEKISGYAYIGGACLFAIEHHLWLAGLLAGLVYGELYKTYKNLWVPISAHAVTNALLGAWVVFTGQWNYW